MTVAENCLLVLVTEPSMLRAAIVHDRSRA